MVLLSSERKLIKKNLSRYSDLTMVERYNVSILGRSATICVIASLYLPALPVHPAKPPTLELSPLSRVGEC